MPEIGCLGDIAFEVSEETVRTLRNMQWSGAARYAAHQRACGNTLTEFTGLGPDGFTFELDLLAQLGTDPMEDITRLWSYERSGQPVPLTIGTHAYGRYRWSVISHKTKIQATDAAGNVIYATVSVTLQEYLRG